MSKIIKLFYITVCIVIGFPVQAQESVEMADSFRAEGKIYVLLTMILIILIGFILYIILLDRKISRLEKRLTDKNSAK